MYGRYASCYSSVFGCVNRNKNKRKRNTYLFERQNPFKNIICVRYGAGNLLGLFKISTFKFIFRRLKCMLDLVLERQDNQKWPSLLNQFLSFSVLGSSKLSPTPNCNVIMHVWLLFAKLGL